MKATFIGGIAVLDRPMNALEPRSGFLQLFVSQPSHTETSVELMDAGIPRKTPIE